MDPSSLLRCGQIVTTVAGAVSLQRGILYTPTYPPRRRFSFADTQESYDLYFERAMRMSSDAFYDLVDRLWPRLPRRGVSPEVLTAIALRRLDSGNYLNLCDF